MNQLRSTGTLLLACMLAASTGHGQVVVNEVCASNMGVNTDNFGEYEDWIELYNTTGAAVNIGGWWMSDDPAATQKWAFPAGTSIPANGHLLVYCSGRNSTAAPFHTNFKLTQTNQEHAVLSDAGGIIIDDFGFTLANRCQVDHSRGRTTSGAGTWSLFTTPTPGAANAAAAAEYVARPVLAPAAGFYGGAQNVSITCATPGATIRYTTDGTIPTAASTAYAGPIAVNATTVVRAACFLAGAPVSFTETNTYFINANHTVAVLSIAGDELDDLLDAGNGAIRPLGSFEYFGPNGALRDEAVGEFNEHGQDSWAYGQRGFDYVVRDQAGYNDAINYPVFRTKTRDKYQRLIVKAAAGDNLTYGPGQPAHIRDAYVQALSQVGGLALDERSYEPCVLYLNGQYWGVYDMREKVDDADFTKYYYDQGEDDLYFLKTWGGTWSEYGGAAAQADWDALRAFINANNMGDPTAFAYVDSLLNWESLIDYFCLNSYTVCADWLNWNTAWWRGLNPNGDKKRWRYALWDMDATFGHYTNFTGIPDQSANADPCNAEQLPDPGGQGHTEILTKLVAENQQVHDHYVNRYIDLGNTLFSCTNMIAFLDSLVALIDPEMPGQCTRWGTPYATWQANVQNIRDFINQRCATIDSGLVDCYNVEGPYPVVFNVDPPLSGQIKINSITPPIYPFSGDYFGGITTTLAPLPATGWVFSHWTVNNNVVLPSLNDSLVTLDFTGPDSIVAHFIPPISYDVVLMVDPLSSATMTFNGTTYTTFPVTVQVPEGVAIPMEVFPARYFDFRYWEIRNNYAASFDSTLLTQSVTFYESDTIIAHLLPQEHAYYVPNSFTPNGDGINDVWQPWASVVDLETFVLRIYDRWGELLVETNDPMKSWDGTLNGTPVQSGVYAFHATFKEGITKEAHDVRGHLTVIR
ncbi:MAG: CotH kinase family protein [Flavobacteriales bacterium]|nr:CotH kinase family protein [Flavobacteriales bacterium]